MKRKSLVGLLLAASLGSATMATPPEPQSEKARLEEILRDSRIRKRKLELGMKYPFVNETRLNYRMTGSYFIFTGESEGSLSTRIDITPTSAIANFDLEGALNLSILSGEIKEHSRAVIDDDKFTSVVYQYESNKSRNKFQEVKNNDLSKTMLDELSVIQYIRSLDLSEVSTNPDEALKFDAIGVNKMYDILVSRSDRISPVETSKDITYKDFWHMRILLDKKPRSRTITAYYTKDDQKLPIYFRLNINGVDCRFYLQDVER